MRGSRPSLFMIIPNTKRHPINTKTDQLPISEVTTGLPRPYHHIYPHFTIFFHFFRQKQLFCFLSKLKVADRRVQNEAETLLSTWQKPDRGKQNTNSYIYTDMTREDNNRETPTVCVGVPRMPPFIVLTPAKEGQV